MKMRQKVKQLTGILLSFVLMLGLLSGMGSTAYAATLDGNSITWSEDSTITGDVEIEVWDDTENEWLGVTVTDDITLTIPAGCTLTVRNGINAEGHTLTVQGEGTLIVYGKDGQWGDPSINGISGNVIVRGSTVEVTGGNGEEGDVDYVSIPGHNGAIGINGDVTVEGGAVTVTGGTGGIGGPGRDGEGTDGAEGGPGGSGIKGTVTVKSGDLTVIGGTGGIGGNGGYGTAVLTPTETWDAYGGDGAEGGWGASGIDGDVIVRGGTVTVTGGTGGEGGQGGSGDLGGRGGDGRRGSSGIKGDVTVMGGIVTVTGGRGGDGGLGGKCNGAGRSGDGGYGGNGYVGVDGSVTVKGGSITVAGGEYGRKGSKGWSPHAAYLGKDGSDGAPGRPAVTETVTSSGTAEESDDNSSWNDIAWNISEKRYVRAESSMHEHFLTYSASGATITATCGVEGCDLPEVDGKHTATLTIAAPPHTTCGDGLDPQAVITDEYSLRGDAAVSYYKAIREDSGYTKTGPALTAAPTEPGDYAAEITLETEDNTVTASIGYTISKADPIAAAPAGLTAVYGQTLADVKLTNPDGNTEGTWTWADKATTSVGKPGSNIFKANFTPTNTDIYKSVSDVEVTVVVSRGTQTITAADVNAAYGDTDKRVSAASDGDGAISYAVKTGSEDLIDVDAATGALTIKKIGTAAVVVTAAQTENYNAATKEVTVTIGKAAPTVNPPTAKTLHYTGASQELVTAGSAIGGKMYYALTTGNQAPAHYTAYSTSIPEASLRGTYYVWYKVVGDENHYDTEPVCIPVEIDIDEAIITGADMVLNGTLDLRFYVATPRDIDESSAYMSFSITGKSARTSETAFKRATYHVPTRERVFAFPVYSIEMAETVTAVFHYTKDGEARTVSKEYSVREYLNDLENQKPHEKILAQINAIRNYGHYMQQYLKELHGFTVGEGEGFDYQAMPAASAITPLTELKEFERKWGAHGYDAAVLKSMGYYDSFDASTTLNIRLEFKEAPGTVSATVNGKTWTVKQLDSTTYLIEIPDIDAYHLGKPWHAEVTADGSIVYDAELSALSYVSAVLASERYQAGEAEALTAFYNYYDAVNPYHT